MPRMPEPAPETILSVAAFTRRVKDLLERNIPPVWVQGEVSNLRRQSSGHIYFTLKDRESQLSCVLFRGDAVRMTVNLRDGLGLAVYGEVSVYEPRGTHQLICRQVVEAGDGHLQLAFERLKKQLAAEGLFEAERKRPLPVLPRTMAFITSPTGAALRDFVGILQRRGWTGTLLVVPARVQGTEAPAELVRGLHWVAAQSGTARPVDLVVIGRGGGSIEDLWSFNDEAVVRAIAALPVPVISAVGHEIDVTLSDFAADKRAETPSAAAELISSAYIAIVERLRAAAGDLQRNARYALERRRHRLDGQYHALKARSPRYTIERLSQRTDDLCRQLDDNFAGAARAARERLAGLERRLSVFEPVALLRLSHQRLASLDPRPHRAVTRVLQQRRERLSGLETRLQNAGLDRVLKRGFAVVRDAEGRFVTDAATVQAGEALTLVFRDGEVCVRAEGS